MTATKFVDDSPIIFRCGTEGCGCPTKMVLSDYVAKYKLRLNLRGSGALVPGSSEDNNIAIELAEICASLTEE